MRGTIHPIDEYTSDCEMDALPRQRRTQLAIGQQMVEYFQKNKMFRISDLTKHLQLNTAIIMDWIDLYQRFNQGPQIREMTVNNHVVYEVVQGRPAQPPAGTPIKLAPTKGIRRTKLQKGIALEAFLTQQRQAFFRTTMEEALGMKSAQARSWIALYQLFNQGPRVVEEEAGKGKYTVNITKV